MIRPSVPCNLQWATKGQFVVEDPQAAASCIYKRRKEHVHTSAPYKLAIAHMQAAGEWRSWLAPHTYLYTCVYYETTVIYIYRQGIYMYTRAKANPMRIYRATIRARVGVRDRSKAFTFGQWKSTQSGPAKLKLACPM